MDFTPVQSPSPVDSSTWQVPAYRIDRLAERKHDYCVVIPVINEGKRIADLLRRMSELGTPSLADILIVDGGSTDGSLDLAMLSSRSVTALITKTGPGKLSAQLRCGYAYALEAGYAGIVTIDGNNKDDPEPIGAFIEALQNGVDFVQASRFIPGGIAENTPLTRWVAIRLLHAPLSSLAGRKWWTDTTQGFRAYSRRLLFDDRIQPFRDVFATYELLAYLSVRAPRLGYVCIELPTARRYPPGEVPTKISSIRGNFKVFRILLAACLGAYNP
ncbi:MAG TPA: glycosyltransferase family 2 protein [Lacipirellulaceae bacterium]|jgi:glycosyltransferase involved in cell wall biosynthesis|nr:glycosyltransferase family 2 protein [Lacipirellulaceae bacterium]